MPTLTRIRGIKDINGNVTGLWGPGGVSFGQSNVRSSKILSRCITGRCKDLALTDATYPANSNTNGLTLHYRVALADHFDSIRIGIPNLSASTQAGVVVGVSASNTLGAWSGSAPSSNATGAAVVAAPTPSETPGTSGETFYKARFGGALSATLPVAVDATNLVPSYTWTDWNPITSIARTDGGTLPLVDIRLFYPAGTVPSLAYNGSTYTAWAVWGRDDIVTGGKAYRVFAQAVEAVATPANFTSATTVAYHVPIIIQYKSRNGGVSIARFGDSIWDGGTSTYQNNGFAWQAVKDLAASGYVLEDANFSVPGQTTINLGQIAGQLMPYIKPTVCAFESASVNNYGASLGSRTQQHGRGALGTFLALCAEYRASPLTASFLPVTNAAKAYGATDSQRVTLNTFLAAQSLVDKYTYVDFGTVMDGVVTSGQVEPAVAYITGDGIHPNDAGHTAMLPLYKAGLLAAMRKA